MYRDKFRNLITKNIANQHSLLTLRIMLGLVFRPIVFVRCCVSDESIYFHSYPPFRCSHSSTTFELYPTAGKVLAIGLLAKSVDLAGFHVPKWWKKVSDQQTFLQLVEDHHIDHLIERTDTSTAYRSVAYLMCRGNRVKRSNHQ